MENAGAGGRQDFRESRGLASAQYSGDAENSSVVMAFEGELDIGCKAFFVDVLERAESYERVTVDLTGVTYMDSMVLNALVHVQRRRSPAPRLRVIVASPQHRRLFVLAKLEKMFDILHVVRRRAV